jgi:hypothetical protein
MHSCACLGPTPSHLYLFQVTVVGSRCFGVLSPVEGMPLCDWAHLTNVPEIWAKAGVTEQMSTDWHEAVGPHASTVGGACAAVALGGLACFVSAVKMVVLSMGALVPLLLNIPGCQPMPSLLMMCFLSEWWASERCIRWWRVGSCVHTDSKKLILSKTLFSVHQASS